MSYVGLFVMLFVDEDDTPLKVGRAALQALEGASIARDVEVRIEEHSGGCERLYCGVHEKDGDPHDVVKA